MAPIEAASDGDEGRHTARSEADSHDSSHGDGIEVEELPDDYTDHPPEMDIGEVTGQLRQKTSSDPPAPVTPIGKIPRIPSIESLDTHPLTNPTRPIKRIPVHEIPKVHLVGKTIDEWGDIVDDDGSVLGRIEGDLPSMVGRKISNAKGDVLGDDGSLLGYVAYVGSEGQKQKKFADQQMSQDEQKSEDEQSPENEQQSPEKEVPTWSLEDVMKAMAATGQGPPAGGLRVDPFGNILDAQGNPVGSFHDNITGFGRKSGAFPEDNASGSKPRSKSKSQPKEPEAKRTRVSDKPQGTATERRDKAQEENPLNPSDIFMDVKSTVEGIQLTIRIPTVFSNAGAPVKPKIVFE